MADELDDHRAFLAGLPDPAPSAPAEPRRSPAAPSTPSAMDEGAAHLAATLTELKVSNERLHADLAQRMRTLEAKVDAGLPDWKLLTDRLVQAGERAGRQATEPLVVASREAVQEARYVTDVRAEDLRLFRNVAGWGALPLFGLALAMLLYGMHLAGTLKPVWGVAAAFVLGVCLTVMAYRLQARVSAFAKQPPWAKRR